MVGSWQSERAGPCAQTEEDGKLSDRRVREQCRQHYL